jgi:hypothetical protein
MDFIGIQNPISWGRCVLANSLRGMVWCLSKMEAQKITLPIMEALLDK